MTTRNEKPLPISPYQRSGNSIVFTYHAYQGVVNHAPIWACRIHKIAQMTLPVTNELVTPYASKSDVLGVPVTRRLSHFAATNQKRREAPLGIDSQFCGHPSSTKNPEKTSEQARKRRFSIQSVATRLLWNVESNAGANLGQTIGKCLRCRKDVTRGVVIESDGEAARYSNLMVCRKFWICAHCAARMSEQDKRRLNAVMVAAQARGWIPVLATYTMRHSRADNLEALIEINASARRWMKSNSRFRGDSWQTVKKTFGVVAGVINLEVTYGDENAWHPHNHEILFIDPEKAEFEGGATNRLFWIELRKICARRWQQAVRRSGGDCDLRRGFSLRQGDEAVSDYIAKFGHDPAATWSIESEVAKSPAKLAKGAKGRTPFQLLADYSESGDKQAGALFVEYARHFDAKHHLHGLTKLEKLLGIDADCPAADDVASEDEKPAFEPVIELPANNIAWRLLCRAEKRADLLTAALDGYHAVLDLLASVGYQGEPPVDLRAPPAAGCHTLQPDKAQPHVVGPPGPVQKRMPLMIRRL